ncbi:hypothetical protein DFH08DRAFT_973866 [Mycena albidolilacea]|uniref:Uncharacterized protein n=1 Tax=Mycena albidolilacea TaxID=1033008 RepID=A0AAD6Z933_9AGAR|nr:hypothetical protein DFH08DRAFT_979671 [Mycena albidolilacea]KAJ7311783.1 hypothetical protein DFH08DRAFT_973866 [Mycena albidolilacea]
MPVILLHDMDYEGIREMRESIEKHIPEWPRLQTGLLYPDGNTLHQPYWVKAPVIHGLKRARKITELEVDMWIDGGRGGFEGTNDASLTSIRIDRFPFDEPRDLKHSYTIAVASQDQHGMFLYPENRLIRGLEPGLLDPWRGNVLVFKHGSTASKAIVNITDEDVALVEAILKRVLRDGLIEYPFLSVTMQTRAVRKLRSENYRDIFFATADLRRRTLLGEVMSLARARIEFYTTPFFPTSKLVTMFFHELEDRRAWIVGSVALAALSFSCDLVVPNNLNVITSALTEDAWITFFRDLLGYKLRSVPCGSFYVKLARSRLIFTHDDIEHKTITITVSREVEIFELFLRARSTLMANAISAQELICTYVDLTSNLQGLSGYTPAFTRPLDVSFSERTSPFPHEIVLLDSTESLGRPCGLACPARTRISTDIAGIGHWAWGGVDNIEWEEDANLIAMNKSDITYKSGAFAYEGLPLVLMTNHVGTVTSATVPRAATTNWIQRTPSPVLTTILLWSCGSYFRWDGDNLELDDRHMPLIANNEGCTFLDTRNRVQLVCYEWHALVTNSGGFWSSYMVRPFESASRFREWTRHMTASPSHIAIALPSVRVPTSVCNDPVSVQDIISLLRGQAANCATLIIAAPDSPWMPALAEGIRNVIFPAIERLALVVCDNRNRRLGRRRPAIVANQPAFGAFSAARFCPSMLRLEGFGFFWTDSPNMINLSTLMLQFLGPEADLTVHELHLVFKNATALERLSIHMVHVAGSYLPNTNIAMNSLKSLEYKPGGNVTLGLLMANLHAPALFDLHLSLGDGDMQIALQCGALFETAVNLRISCNDEPETSIRALYAITPAVTTLDIVYTPLRFHCSLYYEDSLPQLHTLVRHDIWFEMLYNLGTRRRGLRRLVLYRPEEPVMWACGMNAEELTEMLKLVNSVEYIDELHKQWYM